MQMLSMLEASLGLDDGLFIPRAYCKQVAWKVGSGGAEERETRSFWERRWTALSYHLAVEYAFIKPSSKSLR